MTPTQITERDGRLMMELIGFIFLLLVMLWLSFISWFIVFHGGEEFSPAPIYVSVLWITAIVLFWWALLSHAPFSYTGVN